MNLSTLKKVVVALLTLILAYSFVLPSFAAQTPESEIEPFWDGISTVNLTLTFSNGVGSVTATARKKTAAESIEGVLTLYQQNGNDWDYITEWSGSKRIGTLSLGDDFAAVQGATYKVVFTVTAYVNGFAETDISEEIKTYN